jgi:hypothetical protein
VGFKWGWENVTVIAALPHLAVFFFTSLRGSGSSALKVLLILLHSLHGHGTFSEILNRVSLWIFWLQYKEIRIVRFSKSVCSTDGQRIGIDLELLR